jgi:hypothetical protein
MPPLGQIRFSPAWTDRAESSHPIHWTIKFPPSGTRCTELARGHLASRFNQFSQIPTPLQAGGGLFGTAVFLLAEWTIGNLVLYVRLSVSF